MDELAGQGGAVEPSIRCAPDRVQKAAPHGYQLQKSAFARVRTGHCCQKAAGGFGIAAPEKAELRVRSPYESRGLSRWCMSLLVLNTGTTFSDTATSAPLRGFRPVRASRF